MDREPFSRNTYTNTMDIISSHIDGKTAVYGWVFCKEDSLHVADLANFAFRKGWELAKEKMLDSLKTETEGK